MCTCARGCLVQASLQLQPQMLPLWFGFSPLSSGVYLQEQRGNASNHLSHSASACVSEACVSVSEACVSVSTRQTSTRLPLLATPPLQPFHQTDFFSVSLLYLSFLTLLPIFPSVPLQRAR